MVTSKSFVSRIKHEWVNTSGCTIVLFLLCLFLSINTGRACPSGDLSGDCKVNIDDLAIFVAQWLDPVGCVGHETQCADFIGNDGVDLEDFVVFAEIWGYEEEVSIVINEIHYHPDNNTEKVEFVELYNAGNQPVDLNGWYLEGAIAYTFQSMLVMNPGGYIVVSQDPIEVASKFSVASYGPFEGKLSNEGENLILRDSNGNKIDEVSYDSEFPWPVAANGEGASMELINPSLDNDLAGSWRSSGYNQNARPELSFGSPTPGAMNSVYAVNAAPQIRQVNHQPQQPLSTEPIIITAKITDPNGVSQVNLVYQVVTPGNYIPAYLPIGISSLVSNPYQDQPLNSAFENSANWTTISMLDDGGGVDQFAGDGIYTCIRPAQPNRTLLRYRIEATDSLGNNVRVPYCDDPSLNFACFIYDGVADYVVDGDTSVNPDAQAGSNYTYSADTLSTIPVYTLITRDADLYMCNGYDLGDQINQGTTDLDTQYAGRAYNWEGCFVYDGKVYDHIGYRLRGGNGRYNNGAAGKRSMKFRFNRGNYFQARDIYGKKFPSKWQHLNTGKMFGNWVVWGNYRLYPYGVNEVIDTKLFDLAGVPSPQSYWMHFRVIDGANEAPTASGGQYDGDFWGLYIAFENYDAAFLDRLDLPKGNVYKLSDKIYGGLDQLRYQGESAVQDASDYENIRWNLNYTASADWIREHLDCDEWYRYHTVIEAIRSFDVFSGPDCGNCVKNLAWYFYPDYTAENNYYGKVQFMPFDYDDSWGPYFNQGVDHGRAAIFDEVYVTEGSPVQMTIQPGKSPLKQEYRNYIREFRDLLWQPEVIDPLIAELASVIADIVPADRDRWKEDPTTGGPLDFGTLEDDLALMFQFAWNSGTFNGGFYWPGTSNNLDTLANADGDDTNIPDTPTITYIGEPNYPENDLQFQVSAFSDPQGSGTFAAMKWRIAEVEPSTGSPQTLTLLDQNQTWKYFKGTQEPPSSWKDSGFDDSDWLFGQASIGYSDDDDLTVLSDMQNNYTSVYLRNTFIISDVAEIDSLKLHVYVDDGCIIYINGTEVTRLYCSTGDKYYNSTTGTTDHEAPYSTGIYDKVTLMAPYDYLVNGTNVIAVHALQATTGSSDFSFDVSVTTDLRDSASSTPVLLKKKYELQAIWESGEITSYASDIRIPADGITTGKTYRVRCKMKDDTGRWSHWSDPIEFVAGEALGTDLRDHLRITEVMYNNGDAEFIELKNTGMTTLDLSAVSFTNGVTFAFAGSNVESLPAGQYVLVVKDQAAFQAQYGTDLSSLIAGEFVDSSLSNSGETIKLEDNWDGTIVEFEYNDARGWPLAADGAGHSLVPLASAIDPSQPKNVLNYGGNWRQSTYIGGSPGADDPILAAGAVINEFMAHTDYTNPSYPDYDSNDWIELYNAGTSSIGLDGNWYLSDDSSNLKKWALPSSTLTAGSWVSYDEVTGFHSPITSGFGLDKAGEQIFLSYLSGTSQDRVVDCIAFKGQENSVSLGRYPDGGNYWFNLNTATQNSSNQNTVSHVVITEFMYHPLDGKEEYVEIHNPTGVSVPLTITLPLAGLGGWALDGAVNYEFPSGTPALAASGTILIVGFDPTDAGLLGAFETSYGISGLTAGVDIFGPWSGDLSNGGERLTLEKPQDSDDPLDPLTVSWIIIDECIYSDSWPWPTEPDGTGLALHRISMDPAASGNDPDNWQADNSFAGL